MYRDTGFFSRSALSGRFAMAVWILAVLLLGAVFVSSSAANDVELGKEVSVRERLVDGDEQVLDRGALIQQGATLFNAMWTSQEGGGRPLTTGTGGDLADPSSPLVFPRNANRISAPDANSCGGCHNLPRSGGGGDIVTNVFVLGQRFDHVTFDHADAITGRGALDEDGKFPTLDEIANSRATLGMFGSGYVEMLARQMSTELRAIAGGMAPGTSAELVTKGVSFGTLVRNADGTWDTAGISGLPPASAASAGQEAPNLIIRPFHQVGAVISVREFTNNAFNHHHGIQSSERFGDGTDPDGDGFTDELSRPEVTAATIYQTTLAVPGRRIPRFRPVEEAVLNGEDKFVQIGCGGCHVPQLPLDNWGWVYIEPNPFNPPGNAGPGDIPEMKINLNSQYLPQPRLRQQGDVTWVPAYTDLKLHDITTGPDDPNCEELDQHRAGTPEFFDGNCKFLTKKLWGVANEPPYFHHGKYMTMREAIEAHAGEAQSSADAWAALDDYDRDSIIEFLKTLQLLPEGTKDLVIDEKGRSREWPPAWAN
ncbi:MAG: thiol oxidoreductase [Thermoanaerobaculia bacterium]|nr:thiol oxidoreductase [Thermoanaerobaculia bacterium]